jgi:hypothetical protein
VDCNAKVLHLCSNWRWTGPTEPVLQSYLGLQQRSHDVLVACRGLPEKQQTYETVAEKRTMRLLVNSVLDFSVRTS